MDLTDASALVSLRITGRLDTVSVLVLASFVVSIIASLIAHNPRFLLAKEGLITGAWGVWFLASLAAQRPAAFVFARPLMEGRRVFTADGWDVLWQSEPRFRRIWRTSSIIWGGALLMDQVSTRCSKGSSRSWGACWMPRPAEGYSRPAALRHGRDSREATEQRAA